MSDTTGPTIGELAACPYCGEAMYVHGEGGYWEARCIHECTRKCRTIEEAIERANRRVLRPDPPRSERPSGLTGAQVLLLKLADKLAGLAKAHVQLAETLRSKDNAARHDAAALTVRTIMAAIAQVVGGAA